jgi:pimeloyl-ACP methyl ester carboxylesterase
VSDFASGRDERETAIVLVPGYFSNSRQGPYGLYTRLARSWSLLGFRTIVFDPAGSGESSMVARSFRTDVESLLGVVEHLLAPYHRLLLVSHSMGAAVALAATELIPRRTSVWALAPICRLEELSHAFLTPEQLQELKSVGVTRRHGIELHLGMINDAATAWERLATALDLVVQGGADRYAETVDLRAIATDRTLVIDDADHNFSRGSTANELRLLTTDLLFDLS